MANSTRSRPWPPPWVFLARRHAAGHHRRGMAIGLLVGFGLRAAAIDFNLRGPRPAHPHAGTTRSVAGGMHAALLPSPIGPLYVERDALGLTKLYTDGHRLHAEAGPDDGHFEDVARPARRVLRRRAHGISAPAPPARHAVRAASSGTRCARSPTARPLLTANSPRSSAASLAPSAAPTAATRSRSSSPATA